MRLAGVLAALCALLFACGTAGCTAGAPSLSPPSASPRAENSKGAPDVTAARAGQAPEEDDADEGPVTVRMTPLFTSKKLPRFPRPTVGDRECWQDVELTGEARRDYAALVARCGAPTGGAEYARPAMGHAHRKRDQRDSFRLELARGFCYRYFAVADSTIQGLDILVERYGGDLVGNQQTKGPVAIIQEDGPWCMDDDADYDFEIAVDGGGRGQYVLGVWARPADAP